MRNRKKEIPIVILGNIVEYYDFLLFAHLGPLITPLFFSGLSPRASHLLSLFLFGTSFIFRPIGGYIFGYISDLKGRKKALISSMKWSVLPAIIFFLLPTTETLGVSAAIIFVLARIGQGISLGGEYTTAGTYLMESNTKFQGFTSGILAASGTIGSLIAFFFSYLCLQEWSPTWLWRICFLVGGIGSFVSFFMRRHLHETHKPNIELKKTPLKNSSLNLYGIFLIGLLVGTTTWIPMVYSNYYLTKIAGFPTNTGLLATLTALISYLLFTPLFGFMYDRFTKIFYIRGTLIGLIPVVFLGFFLVIKGYIIAGQLLLIIGASAFGAPIHVMMNQIFPVQERGRRINLFFSLGLSVGAIAPSISGFVLDQFNFIMFPPLLVSVISLVGLIVFEKIYSKDKNL